MAPYVRKSFNKHFKNGLIYIMNQEDTSEVNNSSLSIDDDVYTKNSKVYKYALDMTTKELNQAVEGMYHNLNTLQSRSGN